MQHYLLLVVGQKYEFLVAVSHEKIYNVILDECCIRRDALLGDNVWVEETYR